MKEGFEIFLRKFEDRIHELFHHESDINELSINRGLPQDVWDKIMELKPLSVAIPENFGGRGAKVSECLSILAAASYESLPLSLTFGINIALFLEPLARYGHSDVQQPIFDRFLHHKAMGGLMITEPDFGSDALNMRTQYEESEAGYKLKGQKHWQGLTGMADFWIIAARKDAGKGDLARDVEFFVTDNSRPEQQIQVEHYFNNLGLYMIPYGMNTIDLEVPANQKLLQKSTGIKMMLDILHRSRLQFPGMGMGFIKRMLDEALSHCTNRKVGGQQLLALDSVQYQISRIQSSYSLCSGMCARSSSMSGIDQDLATAGLEANSMKALVTDLMQEAAQICVQLSGSSGYKIDHVAGRGIVDSRPFQIFEGSNEMLYTQIAEMVIKQMKKSRETNFGQYLQGFERCDRVAVLFKPVLDFQITESLVQRQMVVLGKIIARLVCLQYVGDMTDKGFRTDLYDNCVKHIEMDIKKLLSDFLNYNDAKPIVEYEEQSNWIDFI
ncbi:acyl-CoA dehydrogenase family protein [Sphingobacterium spiritivorum]|uniref:Acyl-CoA dehydrogenase, C-terminal domain protein n=1 Tax=Sphingobacterium spiritivorum ATCC 33861 TaxID=525373 RepID=D7VQP6_SPHSI|nr:acyl-CoA dehydrogenase family protein [Sphingobacterium spiritivorum]EFK56097.1 acyl-CoA dehydrogenase, C-terminal domain protein [Sphingobacterium spiritivorum ATCC 33861]WQD36265.1 acyl-CoA dehydrogenase family protein [Sphingobacterium spiritivorum]SUJ10309.1 Acyl-CoA dehydrogenase, short-chain specific [Sphingobacterium spiritivorum]